jgi:2-phospho-L-lactate guanylyltransferase
MATDIWAVVPVKALHLAKQRLGRAYAPGLRCALARAMLEDVLDTLNRVSGIAGIAVVTADREVARIAGERKAAVFAEEIAGDLNAAILGAARRLARDGRAGMLVLASDLPAITVQEVESLLALHRRNGGLTIVPDRDGRGTNAMLMTPPGAMATAFGEDSFARHLRSARAAGITARALPLSGMGLDLDHPEDVAEFARKPSSTRTWRYLAACGLTRSRQSARIS